MCYLKHCWIDIEIFWHNNIFEVNISVIFAHRYVLFKWFLLSAMLKRFTVDRLLSTVKIRRVPMAHSSLLRLCELLQLRGAGRQWLSTSLH
mmetsp:Transcript_20526/g.44046  ORF Transcript_20526/g.44046 Transcript_20526/m.44046 type:complete len:91 (-) Transcript_20526:338-610(-)